MNDIVVTITDESGFVQDTQRLSTELELAKEEFPKDPHEVHLELAIAELVRSVSRSIWQISSQVKGDSDAVSS